MQIFEFFKAILLGIIEGITEWLPVSSTGHMILFDSFWSMDPVYYRGKSAFIDLFLVVIQLGAILAVIVLYRHKLNPFSRRKTPQQKKSTWDLWLKVFIGSIPCGIVGVLFEKKIKSYLFNAQVVAAMLILYGILFIVIENMRKKSRFSSTDVLPYQTALYIGLFECLSLVPGTSRSGATILGAVLLGCARPAAAEFSFFLAIPAMIVASLKDILDYFQAWGFGFSSMEAGILLTGMAVAFIVSIFAVKSLMKFVRRHDFKPFGWYRIALGAVVVILSFTPILKVGV
ncbi:MULTISPECIES: undecaprenyl-diphosphate phosphatase [Caproicibacterium]|uniref:Undecaprenyl-diphosphatase n=1 Tax=Caproicibacterium argilliputei TaxID=3030016 RepID=A0AA97H2B5_9FIRM|nr:undecaprenyl-diphosphate phosphatase [Caproicibacterium argilliputei]WOC32550.1 undecaprenyl-diphosphate phosphatase [Caproicibacterium argilliputei]